VRKVRNLLGVERRRDYAAMKTDAQAINQAASRTETEGHTRVFARQWRNAYPQ
jgi:transposase-like protein